MFHLKNRKKSFQITAKITLKLLETGYIVIFEYYLLLLNPKSYMKYDC